MATSDEGRLPGARLRRPRGNVRAVNYAGTLGLEDTRAVHFAFDADEADRMRDEWAGRPMRIPLEVKEAHYRDLGDPLLRYLRELTADQETVAVVVMPELIFSRATTPDAQPASALRQAAPPFEPRVILTAVPYRLTDLPPPPAD